ncbi:hypothetical protein RND71_009606 [Anisodus tanguticus]|uniref:Uncharacterized protein n=1 Tax=Anisodus tanguticus TaxID=243964 RepID=A0AAE1SK00_9SOLA|nr:hypothetical protein RND71_009606 [Anisodus tanguticus]
MGHGDGLAPARFGPPERVRTYARPSAHAIGLSNDRSLVANMTGIHVGNVRNSINAFEVKGYTSVQRSSEPREQLYQAQHQFAYMLTTSSKHSNLYN